MVLPVPSSTLRRTLPPLRAANSIADGTLVWRIEYDRKERVLYVFFNDEYGTETRVSADGLSLADVRYADDGIPVVCSLEIHDPIRTGVIEDWIIEGAELAMSEFEDYELPIEVNE